MPEATSREGTRALGRWARWRARRVEVHDASMAPTLRPGDRLAVDTRAYRDRAPSLGEIVVLVDPDEPERWLVKRVAGVGPLQLWRRASGWTSAPVGAGRPADAVEAVEIPPGSVFVVGDAPGRDSARFGPVPRATLVGRVVRCYAPADRRRNF
jgi:hypothetical protein